MRLLLPNLVTASRPVLAGPLAALLVHAARSGHGRGGVIALFLWVALSDGLDGYLARRLNAQTRLGRLLDPAADKVVALVAFLTLAAVSGGGTFDFPLPPWLVALVIVKDLWLVIGLAVVFMMGLPIRVQPSRLGKAATFGQMLLVGSILIGPELSAVSLGWLRTLFVWLAAAATAGAAVGYTALVVRKLASARIAPDAG